MHSTRATTTDERTPVTTAASTGRLPGAPEPRYRLLYPVGEAADLLGFKKSLVYDLIARGELEAVRPRGELRVPHAALLAFIDRLRAEAGR